MPIANASSRRGFTLVELLVVIAVIGVLVALLLPAIQAAREAARRTECQNHLKQIGLGWLSHHDVQKAFPTGGWGTNWTGDPDFGFGPRQPGGWVYNILPFVEESAIHDIGKGITNPQKKMDALGLGMTKPIALYYCPTRRGANIYPQTAVFNNATLQARVAKCDYAANVGDGGTYHQGPSSVADFPTYPKWSGPEADSPLSKFNGVCFSIFAVKLAHITDGTSHTYMVGEKHVTGKNYETGDDVADDRGIFCGTDNDVLRSTALQNTPINDQVGNPQSRLNGDRFGSAHSDVFNMVFCDGSVHPISFEISAEMHRRLGTRADGLDVPVSEYER